MNLLKKIGYHCFCSTSYRATAGKVAQQNPGRLFSRQIMNGKKMRAFRAAHLSLYQLLYVTLYLCVAYGRPYEKGADGVQ